MNYKNNFIYKIDLQEKPMYVPYIALIKLESTIIEKPSIQIIGKNDRSRSFGMFFILNVEPNPKAVK